MIPALHGAIALTEVDKVSVGIGENLKLDMVRVENKLLEVAVSISETSDRFIRSRFVKLDKFLLFKDRAHSASTSTGGRLHHHREADFFGNLQAVLSVGNDAIGPRSGRNAVFKGGGTSGILITHTTDHLG